MPNGHYSALARFARRRLQLLSQEASLWNEVSEWLTQMPELVAPAPQPNVSVPLSNDPSHQRLLRTSQAADLLGVAASTMTKWRLTGGGPEFVKIGRSVLYRRETLERFILSKTKPHTSAYALAPPITTGRKRRLDE